MDDNIKQSTKRRNKFIGKEDVSRETADYILSGQIDRLQDISSMNNETATKIRESVGILYEKRIPVDTTKFEQLNRYFIGEMENKLRKVKRPPKGLVWYIVMWVITLVSAFLAGYFIHEYREWKEKAVYWYQQYEEVKHPEKSNLNLVSLLRSRYGDGLMFITIQYSYKIIVSTLLF